SAHVELLNNRTSFGELTFDDDDAVLSHVVNGSRVVVLVDGVTEIAGPAASRIGYGPGGSGTWRVEDDFRLFRNIVWPDSSAAIGSQPEYRRFTGPTETVAKAAAADLNALYGFGWTVTPSTGLGASQRVEFRFHPLVDKIVPLL